MSTTCSRGRWLAAAVAGLLLLNVGQSAADPLTFSNVRAAQLDPFVVTELFGNPGALLTNGTIVSFFVDIAGVLPVGSTDTLRVTYSQPGGIGTVVQDIGIPVFGTVYPPFGVVFGQSFPVFYHPVPIALTLDLLQSSPDFVIPGGPLAGTAVDSYTFSFSVVQPIPEPGTLTLIGGALAAATVQRLRRKQRRRA